MFVPSWYFIVFLVFWKVYSLRADFSCFSCCFILSYLLHFSWQRVQNGLEIFLSFIFLPFYQGLEVISFFYFVFLSFLFFLSLSLPPPRRFFPSVWHFDWFHISPFVYTAKYKSSVSHLAEYFFHLNFQEVISHFRRNWFFLFWYHLTLTGQHF